MREINVDLGRKLSVENAERIGHGYASDVYQLDEDTVVKVLKTDSVEEAIREIQLSKWALRVGIPTAISYDVADVDGHPGLVFEMLGRGSLRNRITEHPESFDRRMRQYAELLHRIHAIEDTERRLPRMMDEQRRRLNRLSCLTEEERRRVHALLDTIPETDHIVHCDCHVKNIKVVRDELLLIDLDTLSRGDPIFELAMAYQSYRSFGEAQRLTDYDPFFDLPVPLKLRILDTLIRLYFDGLEEEELSANLRKIELLSELNLLDFLQTNAEDGSYDTARILRQFRECLREICDLRLSYGSSDRQNRAIEGNQASQTEK